MVLFTLGYVGILLAISALAIYSIISFDKLTLKSSSQGATTLQFLLYANLIGPLLVIAITIGIAVSKKSWVDSWKWHQALLSGLLLLFTTIQITTFVEWQKNSGDYQDNDAKTGFESLVMWGMAGMIALTVAYTAFSIYRWVVTQPEYIYHDRLSKLGKAKNFHCEECTDLTGAYNTCENLKIEGFLKMTPEQREQTCLFPKEKAKLLAKASVPPKAATPPKSKSKPAAPKPSLFGGGLGKL